MLTRLQGCVFALIPIAALVLFPCSVTASIRYDESSHTWQLVSGLVEYRLGEKDGSVFLNYFGPAGQPDWGQPTGPEGPLRGVGGRYDIDGLTEGESLQPERLELVSHEILHPKRAVDELKLVFKHRLIPLEITALYTTWGETGVITRQLTLANQGDHPLRIDRAPSLAWQLPAGEYELTYLWGGWGHERQLATEPIRAGRRTFVQRRGRSTNGYSPWFCLLSKSLGVRYLAQLAYSGNWNMAFEQYPDGRELAREDLDVDLGMHFDFGGSLQIAQQESFALPQVAFTATSGDLDEGANQLHRYQRQYVVPRTATNDPLLVQFNSWYPFPGEMTVGQMERCADVAKQLGAEVFVLDAGWFSSKDWSRELGDWTPNRAAFPHGLGELADYVRSKSMKFGLWVEIENLGVDSKTFREHPDWCLQYNGKPLMVFDRYHLDFAKPEVRQWARSVIDRFVHDYGIEWLKIDYNIDIGDHFDPPGDSERRGDVLYQHLMNYYKWLDEIRAAYPQLVIENCSSGGTRFDLDIIAHTHTTWLSDNVGPLAEAQLGYGCTVEFIPEVCNHWMVGDKDDGEVLPTDKPGWWDYMLRVPMNGQYGISSRVFDWSAALLERAADNVALYKRIRQVIMGADVYHLTSAPNHEDPTGWSAIQYVSPDASRSVIMAYRLGNSQEVRVFKLRGLDAARQYRVSIGGAAVGARSGQDLARAGLRVELDEVWRAAVVEVSSAE
jgi:alpha-galactosidase